jgi:hypothetical protein
VGDEQFVSDAASGDWLYGLRDGAHPFDKIERPLRHAPTFFGTGFKMLAGHCAASGMAAAASRSVEKTPILRRLRSSASKPVARART